MPPSRREERQNGRVPLSTGALSRSFAAAVLIVGLLMALLPWSRRQPGWMTRRTDCSQDRAYWRMP